ncbi:MAG: LacI family DNA-binding transcriptional regulator [Treponema sp.]|nr:LacI family DNA-binding transcriptional regulator [Candidatus Treponema caballi]
MKKVTIETVAQRVGVSAATVSYALSGKKKISPEVKAKIDEAIKELGYRPSITARNLASNKNWTVGLFASPTGNIREDFFFNNILAGVLDTLHEKKYQLMLYADYRSDTEQDNPDFNFSQPIDGALVMNPRVNDSNIDQLKERGIPYVLIGTSEDLSISYFVDSDITAGYYAAVKHLISKGHKKIYLLNGRADYTQSEKRRIGYRQALIDSGIEYDENCILNLAMLEEAGYTAVLEILAEDPECTAVVTFNDTIALGVLKALREHQIAVPGRMAVVSAGNTMITRIHSPSITSIDMAPYAIGAKAAELLIDVIEKRRMQPSHELLQAFLVERESS